MKTAFWIACFGFLGAHSTRPNLDYSDAHRVSASEYVLKYKGFRCLKNKARHGLDVKLYFLCIPEKMRPKEMAALTFDSLALYESVKSETVQNGPVFTLYDGADTMGITLLCKLVEGKTDDSNTMNHLNEVLKDFKISYYSENQPPTSNLEVPAMDTAKGDIANTNNASNPNRKSSSWIQKLTTVANLNPMSIVTWIFQPKTKEMGKKYLYVSSKDLKCYVNTPPTKAYEIEHHFSMTLQKDKSVYEVYFEIMPK